MTLKTCHTSKRRPNFTWQLVKAVTVRIKKSFDFEKYFDLRFFLFISLFSVVLPVGRCLVFICLRWSFVFDLSGHRLTTVAFLMFFLFWQVDGVQVWSKTCEKEVVTSMDKPTDAQIEREWFIPCLRENILILPELFVRCTKVSTCLHYLH